MASERTIGRLSLYRRLLHNLRGEGVTHVYSHELAAAASVSAAQVRRDLMVLGYSGSAARGYEVERLVECVGAVLDAPEGQKLALVGVGHLGRALLHYFAGRRPKLSIAAAFDVDPHKVDRLYHGVRSHPLERLEEIVAAEGISLAILAAPADVAQDLAERLQRAGVVGILNLAPIPLKLGPAVFVEQLDITMSVEKVAYFARQQQTAGEDNES